MKVRVFSFYTSSAMKGWREDSKIMCVDSEKDVPAGMLYEVVSEDTPVTTAPKAQLLCWCLEGNNATQMRSLLSFSYCPHCGRNWR